MNTELLRLRLEYAFSKLKYTIDDEPQDPESADEAKSAIRLALESLPPRMTPQAVEEHKIKAEDTPV